MQVTDPEESRGLPNHLSALHAITPVFVYFIAAGVATVMLGPLLPGLIEHWHIRDAQAGTLFTANFLGQLCGSWVAARNLKASIFYGSAITAGGCAALMSLSYGPAHIALFAIGLGIGAGLTAGNVLAGTAVPALRTRLITFLNIAWGIGAIACPLLITLTARGGIQRFLHVTSVSLAISALISFVMLRSPRQPNIAEESADHIAQGRASSWLPLPPVPLFLFASAMFLYVGVENALGGWLPSYATRSNPPIHASFISLLFWTAELVGRILVVALVSAKTEKTLYRVSLFFLFLAVALLCVIADPSGINVAALTVLSALSLAPIYPLTISFLLARAGNHARLGVLFASACCGGASLPCLTGALSTEFHGLRVGLIVPAAGALLMLAISSVITAKPQIPEH